MTPLLFMGAVFAVSIVAGFFGSLLGLGGGIIVVPALSLWMGVDIRYAIGASIISVIATSSGAGAAYVKDHLVNIRLAMFLEVGTTLGAVAGAFVAGILSDRWLHLVFAGAMAGTAVMMWRHKGTDRSLAARPDRLSQALRLDDHFFDAVRGRTRHYHVQRTGMGLGLGWLAGVMSGLLGIGGGIMKVPAMNLVMGVPMKVASATSNFMIGVTAAASAAVYFSRGDVDPFIAGPTAIGVLCGSLLGARLMSRVPSSVLRMAFTVVLLIIVVQMLRKGLTP
jgi:hypothetical protein